MTSIGGITRSATPSVTATVWGRVEPINGRERFLAQQMTPELTHKITVRYCRGYTVTPAWQVIYDGRTFGIDAVIDREERHVYLELLCKEIVSV